MSEEKTEPQNYIMLGEVNRIKRNEEVEKAGEFLILDMVVGTASPFTREEILSYIKEILGYTFDSLVEKKLIWEKQSKKLEKSVQKSS